MYSVSNIQYSPVSSISFLVFGLWSLVFGSWNLSAQPHSYGYFNNLLKGEKYFVALGYGAGTAKWNSVFESAEFYDKDGRVIHTGDFKFRATGHVRHYEVNVSAPVKKIRLGLGIAFEEHYLSALQVYTEPGEPFILFDEYLRFDKIILTGEVPFKYKTEKKYSFNTFLRTGWYSYTHVKRINFIGERPFPVTFLLTAGITADYEIFPKIYLFAYPNAEYKYYNNARTESPVQIKHHVLSVNIIGGLRFNLAK